MPKNKECSKFSKTESKYWQKRFTLFSLFEKGIHLDEESWYSVTPEKVAKHVACRLRCDIIIDAFCGCGGNTIQFAKTCKKVIAIDKDPKKIAMSKNNAKIYGVDKKIEFIVGDFLHLAPNLKADIVFLSPPWGGPGCTQTFIYDIEKSLIPVPASELLRICRNITKDVILFLPKNSNKYQIVDLCPPDECVEIEKNFLNKSFIGVTAYYGKFGNDLSLSSRSALNRSD